MFGLLKKCSNENSQQQAIFHSSSKNLLNTFDEFVTVQERLRKPHERPNQRCREQSRPSKDESDQGGVFFSLMSKRSVTTLRRK